MLCLGISPVPAQRGPPNRGGPTRPAAPQAPAPLAGCGAEGGAVRPEVKLKVLGGPWERACGGRAGSTPDVGSPCSSRGLRPPPTHLPLEPCHPGSGPECSRERSSQPCSPVAQGPAQVLPLAQAGPMSDVWEAAVRVRGSVGSCAYLPGSRVSGRRPLPLPCVPSPMSPQESWGPGPLSHQAGTFMEWPGGL